MNKYIILLMVALLSFASCDQDNTGEIFNANGEDLVSVSSEVLKTEISSENEYKVQVLLYRTDADKTGTTCELSLEGDDSELFMFENNIVTFEAGKTNAYAVVVPKDPKDLDPRLSYSVTVVPQGDNVSPAKHEMNITISVTPEFVSLGTALYYSAWGEPGVPWERELSKEKLVHLYNIKDLYSEGLDINMYIDNEGKVVVPGQYALNNSDGEKVFALGYAAAGGVAGDVITVDGEPFTTDMGAENIKQFNLTIAFIIGSVDGSRWYGAHKEFLLFPSDASSIIEDVNISSKVVCIDELDEMPFE